MPEEHVQQHCNTGYHLMQTAVAVRDRMNDMTLTLTDMVSDLIGPPPGESEGKHEESTGAIPRTLDHLRDILELCEKCERLLACLNGSQPAASVPKPEPPKNRR